VGLTTPHHKKKPVTNNLHKPRTWADSLIEEDEMGGPCSTNGGEEERVQIIGGKARGRETTRKTKT
jgi:hypothetical protein